MKHRLNVMKDRKREERSRSTRRPESPHEQRPQVIEASETDDPPAKDGPQLAIQDKPARARPRFDPTREHVLQRELLRSERLHYNHSVNIKGTHLQRALQILKRNGG